MHLAAQLYGHSRSAPPPVHLAIGFSCHRQRQQVKLLQATARLLQHHVSNQDDGRSHLLAQVSPRPAGPTQLAVKRKVRVGPSRNGCAHDPHRLRHSLLEKEEANCEAGCSFRAGDFVAAQHDSLPSTTYGDRHGPSQDSLGGSGPFGGDAWEEGTGREGKGREGNGSSRAARSAGPPKFYLWNNTNANASANTTMRACVSHLHRSLMLCTVMLQAVIAVGNKCCKILLFARLEVESARQAGRDS
jgi:hypothetical protein